MEQELLRGVVVPCAEVELLDVCRCQGAVVNGNLVDGAVEVFSLGLRGDPRTDSYYTSGSIRWVRRSTRYYSGASQFQLTIHIRQDIRKTVAAVQNSDNMMPVIIANRCIAATV